MGQAHYVTQEGLDKLREELAAMIAERPVISRAIAEARDKGDLSENAEYDAAREAQGMLELKISKMQDLIANAKVIDESKINTEQVQMLTKVKLKNLGNGAVVTYTLVGESEANIMQGKIAMTTPIGRSLMGHRKGEVVEVTVPSGVIKFEILEISIYQWQAFSAESRRERSLPTKWRKTTATMPSSTSIPWWKATPW